MQQADAAFNPNNPNHGLASTEQKGSVPELDADAIGGVLAAVADVDVEIVGHVAAAWSMLCKAHRHACTWSASHAWSELTALHFANAPIFVENDSRLNFYDLCSYTRLCRTEDRGPHSAKGNKVKAFVFAAVRRNGNLLRSASEKLRADKDVVLAAVRQNGHALMHASGELCADKEVVLAAVRKQYSKQYSLGGHKMSVLMYASKDLRADKEVVLEAVRCCRYAFDNASADLKADPEILRAYLQLETLTFNLCTNSDSGSDSDSE